MSIGLLCPYLCGCYDRKLSENHFVSSFYVKITGTQALACSVGHIAPEQFAGGLGASAGMFLSVLFYFFDTALFFILMTGFFSPSIVL